MSDRRAASDDVRRLYGLACIAASGAGHARHAGAGLEQPFAALGLHRRRPVDRHVSSSPRCGDHGCRRRATDSIDRSPSPKASRGVRCCSTAPPVVAWRSPCLMASVSPGGIVAAFEPAYLAHERTAFAASGIAGGLVYWLFAGRRAGSGSDSMNRTGLIVALAIAAVVGLVVRHLTRSSISPSRRCSSIRRTQAFAAVFGSRCEHAARRREPDRSRCWWRRRSWRSLGKLLMPQRPHADPRPRRAVSDR